MAKITIPEGYHQGMLLLASLDQEQVAILRNVLSTEADDISSRELARIVSPSLGGMSEKDIHSMVKSLLALYAVRSSREASVDDFVVDLAEAVEELPKGSVSRIDIDPFRKNLTSLMTIDPFAIQMKGRDLQTEDERTFCRARILTDLRPVFGDDVSEGTKGMVIVHHLKIGFHKDSMSHSDFYLSMDAQDLQVLKAVIERAEAKAQVIHEELQGTRFLGF